jgi:hypothetical protein
MNRSATFKTIDAQHWLFPIGVYQEKLANTWLSFQPDNSNGANKKCLDKGEICR